MSAFMKAPDVFWLEEVIGADGFFRMVGADIAKSAAAQERGCRYILATPSALAQAPEVQALIQAAVLDGQLRVIERGRIDTPEELRAIRTPDAPASADAGRAG